MSVWVEDLSGAKAHRLVCFTDKHGMTVGFGEERDRPQRCAVFLIEFAGRVDKTHGGFSAIDDSHALEFLHHKSLKGCSNPQRSC
jgi:hypothetical protein